MFHPEGLKLLPETRELIRKMGSDARVLKALDVIHGNRCIEAARRVSAYRFFLNSLVTMAEGGKIAVIESGRDCDCVEYDGRVHIIDATAAAYRDLDDKIGQWADGPYELRLCRVSAAEGVPYETRDLVMEAREDGHPHSIVSRFG